ncbi:hypothetical protein IKF84_02770, partial [Candidatus Saccharibacteria bacterium]|nr:hypothetical protein [Candidatus Saccharibacteria bacterium]
MLSSCVWLGNVQPLGQNLEKRGTSGGECYGDGDTGLGYVSSCIHSGTIAAENTYTGVATNTVWYNYTAISVGAISGVSNTSIATESICPKGWALPNNKQIAFITDNSDETTYIAAFSPDRGGWYQNGSLINEEYYGLWRSSDAYNGAQRYRMHYYNNDLSLGQSRNFHGQYVRCVSEEKDVSDLTYMQDMTAKVAADTPEGMTASLTDRRDGKVYTVA